MKPQGFFEVTLDLKGRFRVPSLLTSFFISHTILSPLLLNETYCVEVYHEQDWKFHIKELSEKKIFDKESLWRFYIALAIPIEKDGQNRILIPPQLRKLAHLQTHLIILNFEKKLEIWNYKTWLDLYKNYKHKD